MEPSGKGLPLPGMPGRAPINASRTGGRCSPSASPPYGKRFRSLRSS
jgi:hypothetical protein